MLIFLALAVIVLDQLTKYMVQSTMTLTETIPLIPNVFHLTYILNPGAAFGMFAHRTLFFIIITALVLVLMGLFYYYTGKHQRLIRFGLALQAGGAVGNLLDRIRMGKVIDFFDFRVFPIFNIADVAIVFGVILICWGILRSGKEVIE